MPMGKGGSGGFVDLLNLERKSLKKRLLWLFLVPFLLPPTGDARGAENQLRVEVFPKALRQGDVYLARATGPASLKSIQGEFQGKKFSLSSAERQGSYEALIGVDLDAKPAKYEMKVGATGGDGKAYSKSLQLKVGKTDFAVQKLSLPRSMVDLDPKTLERTNRESKRLRGLFQEVGEERLWKGPFIRPLEGELSGAFGVRRIINGQTKNPHSGIDLRADEGTPVMACNSGSVALVDELFFSGKTVILDHGGGLYSMYFHLSEAGVSAGDRLRKGETLGRVGSTGRSTGPHLHWGMIIRGARVDPLSFLRLGERLRE
jgi:murein DD-endopeptidase MepM/ murein hydrolase activator NlpD